MGFSSQNRVLGCSIVALRSRKVCYSRCYGLGLGSRVKLLIVSVVKALCPFNPKPKRPNPEIPQPQSIIRFRVRVWV